MHIIEPFSDFLINFNLFFPNLLTLPCFNTRYTWSGYAIFFSLARLWHEFLLISIYPESKSHPLYIHVSTYI